MYSRVLHESRTTGDPQLVHALQHNQYLLIDLPETNTVPCKSNMCLSVQINIFTNSKYCLMSA